MKSKISPKAENSLIEVTGCDTEDPKMPITMVCPFTIVQDAYAGQFSGGSWVAFKAWPDDIDQRAYVACSVDEHKAFWGSGASSLCGRGSTPQEALDDVQGRLNAYRSEQR